MGEIFGKMGEDGTEQAAVAKEGVSRSAGCIILCAVSSRLFVDETRILLFYWLFLVQCTNRVGRAFFPFFYGGDGDDGPTE
ncbi:hypothetical protein [Pandoravirus japonicus]|uniref:Uncharacterized protein n=1 Tax=Pandoravirus japonicus TaxID=2823154 RepID=A0A811BMA2_9VIRU|nr:hypothetical protein [Pandoravirus japonicus]